MLSASVHCTKTGVILKELIFGGCSEELPLNDTKYPSTYYIFTGSIFIMFK